MLTSLRQFGEKISEINTRYRTPRIAMSLGVRTSLLALRLYLVFLVALLLYKFVLLIR